MNEASSHQITCPKCRSEKITPHGKRYALYPSGCFIIFTLPLSWVHRESTPYDFECRACGHPFSKRTLNAKIAYASLWLSGGIIIWWILRMILH